MILTVACGTEEDTTQKPEVTIGELEYELVDVNSTEFEELYSDAEFAGWYDDSYKTEGVYSFNSEEASFILVSAGEKKTGGYSIENIVLTGNENNVEVTADLHVPAEGSPVTQAVTYPNVLLRIPVEERELAFKGFEEIADPAEQQKMLTDSGTYVGQIDANSIEIKISGVPEEAASKAFQLEESLKDNFEQKHGLQSGDQVKFTYFVDEYERPILMTIEKI
jgi:hypothetical protein